MGSTLKWAGSHFTVESILSCAGSTVNYGDETLSVFDIKTRRPIATLSVGTHHQGLAVDSKSNLMYVANVHGDSTTVIDGAVNIVLGVRNAGKHPYAVVIDQGSGRVFAANYAAPWITLVSAAKPSLPASTVK